MLQRRFVRLRQLTAGINFPQVASTENKLRFQRFHHSIVEVKSALRIALLEPFFGGSHQRWAESLQQRSSHEIELFTLPARHWKWRMHGAAVSLANRIVSQDREYDLFLASDMLDIAVFTSLVRHRFANTPTIAYFHENQLCYPWSPRDKDKRSKRDLHYAFINYTSALSSDRVYFNSQYHLESFNSALPSFLSRYPDYQNRATLEGIAAKSKVLPLAMNLSDFSDYKPPETKTSETPILLWNHRWEYDKNPKGFCQLVYELLKLDLDFEVALLGEQFKEEPEYFAQMRKKLGRRIVAYGKEESFGNYAKWLWRANILPVTSRQDFFGGSVVEAIYCGCHPILPNRLAYPNHLDPIKYPKYYYSSTQEAVLRTAELIKSGAWKNTCTASSQMERYDWSHSIAAYDQELASCTALQPN